MVNVDKELDKLTKSFMLSNANVYTEKDGIVKAVALSKIFEWYKDDFVKYSGSVLAYVTAYSGKKFHAKVKVTYKEYLWTLNKQK